MSEQICKKILKLQSGGVVSPKGIKAPRIRFKEKSASNSDLPKVRAGLISKKQIGGPISYNQPNSINSSLLTDVLFPKKTGKELLEHRQKILRTIRPSEYTDLNNYTRYITDTNRKEFDDPRSEEAFAKYLGLNKDLKYLSVSPYTPTLNKSKSDKSYYQVDNKLEQDIFNSFKDKVQLNKSIPVSEFEVNSDFTGNKNILPDGTVKLVEGDENIITGRPMVSRARMLGHFSVSKGKDSKGEYLSYSDEYDFPTIGQMALQGMPYSIYGRIYYPKKK